MGTKGMLVTCKRCGKTVFLKLIGKTDFDGGYSSADKFEATPPGWELRHVPQVLTQLCPTCDAEFTKICNTFMEKKPLSEDLWLFDLDDDRETCGLLEED